MAHEKRFAAWKRHHRRVKSAKAKVKQFEEGKLTYDQLPELAKKFLARRRRFQLKAE
jgi:hypothetical protein